MVVELVDVVVVVKDVVVVVLHKSTTSRFVPFEITLYALGSVR